MRESESDLAVAPEYVPDDLPHDFEPVATVVVSRAPSAPARARLVTLLREAFDIRLEHADTYGWAFLVTAERAATGEQGHEHGREREREQEAD